jgi:hypothetical protein
VVLTTESDNTVEELKKKIGEELSISFLHEFDLVIGVPPATRRLDDSSVRLCDVPVTTGEVIRTQKKELANTVTQSQSPQAKAKPAPARRERGKQQSQSQGQTSAKGAELKPFGGNMATLYSNAPAAAAAAAAPKVKRASSSRSKAGNEEDIADHLLSAVTGGGASRDKMLRKVFRGAVANQYESSKAVARAASLEGGRYTIHTLETAQTLSGTSLSRLHVTFPASGRGKDYEDEVDLVRSVILLLFFLLSLFVMSLSLSLSIYYCMSAFSDTTWHESNYHHTPPPPLQSLI